MKTNQNYVGVDISKEYFDVALPNGDKYLHRKFPNNTQGFIDFFKLLSPSDVVVMEASGPYYLQLAFYLYQQKRSVSVINPLVIRRFCQMRMVRTKTDKKDAQMIACYGKTEHPSQWTAVPEYVLEIQQLFALVSQLKKQQSALERQQEAFRCSPVISKDAIGSLQTILKSNLEQQTKLEEKMQQLIEGQHSQMFKQVQTIPGIGKKTALLLLVVSNGFTKFKTVKQMCSYLGVCPRIYESGKSIKGKAKITKMGMSKIRAALYLCSWSAIKYNKACKELYERLLEKGKPKMVALMAVVNKLIKQAFAIATKKQTYVEF